MGRVTWSDKIVLLCDFYSPESNLLHVSLLQAGCDCVAVSLEENDFLPENVLSVYDMLSGELPEKEKDRGKPRFFNEIAVPDYWTINAGNRNSGNITYQQVEKGKIYYWQGGKNYLVEAVDWYDRKGRVRFRDHYNRYGNICARTVYDADGCALCKTRFSESGKEIFTQNLVTGDMMLHVDGAMKIFRSKVELLVFWFKKKKVNRSRIFYNSLSVPFFISNRLGGTEKRDILFWQEPVGKEIPGNMQMILNGTSERTRHVMVQKRSSYEKLLELGGNRRKIHLLGFIYPFRKKNGHKPEALICTDSEMIERCEELIGALPQMHFHIAAITAMSSRLMELGKYENVSLYPGAVPNVQEELFHRCDYYFDINHGAEIISAVRQAFLYDELIFAFQETAHNRDYVAEEHIYPAEKLEKMVQDVRAAMENVEEMRRDLEKQRKYAVTENAETYADLLELGTAAK